jgi:hypothetical protein
MSVCLQLFVDLSPCILNVSVCIRYIQRNSSIKTPYYRDQMIVVFANKGSLYTGTLVSLRRSMDQHKMASVDKWSFYRGSHYVTVSLNLRRTHRLYQRVQLHVDRSPNNDKRTLTTVNTSTLYCVSWNTQAYICVLYVGKFLWNVNSQICLKLLGDWNNSN